MANESLLIMIVVGLIAGWLAGQIMRGAGFGIIGDLIIGIIGAFIGGWLLPQLSIHIGTGIIGAIINATIGALLLLLVLRLVRGGGPGLEADGVGAGAGNVDSECSRQPDGLVHELQSVRFRAPRR